MKYVSRWAAVLVWLALAACGAQNPTPEASSEESRPSGQITVFAASSLSDAFTEIAAEFEADHPGADVALNFGGSSQLAAQINEGGPADVFAAASQKTLQTVADAGHIEGNPAVFATNRLAILIPSANPAKIAALKDLANPGVKLVLAVTGVPIRDYADQILAKAAADPAFGADFPGAVYANLVSEEDNVRMVVSKIALGEADAGIAYVTDVTPDMSDQITQIDIRDDLNVIATYPIGQIAESKQPELARAFIDFVLSADGQAILARWGFSPKK